jgi:hypothetical protein
MSKCSSVKTIYEIFWLSIANTPLMFSPWVEIQLPCIRATSRLTLKKLPKVSSPIEATTTPVNVPILVPVPVVLITGYDMYNLGTLSFDCMRLL